MNFRNFPLRVYALLLRFYPQAFRERFAPEMMQIAESIAISEWPLVFSDTSIAIVRCWIEGSNVTTVPGELNAYVPVGEFRLNVSGLLPGAVLSLLIMAGVGYINYRWPPACPKTEHLLTHIVALPQSEQAIRQR
jgi:hypothetical protein